VALLLGGCAGAAALLENSPWRTGAPAFTPPAVHTDALGEANGSRAQVPVFTPISPPTPLPAPTPVVSEIAQQDLQEFDVAEQRVIDVYRKVAPSVVSITTRVLRRDFFFDVVPEEGAGSGFVLDQEGHILTNYHVIQGAQRIEVTFGDELLLHAEVVGADPRNDIAILKVNASTHLLFPVELGSSSNLIAGQRAIAIGNPFGQFGRTLTTGVISALDRTLQGPDGRTINGVIQTDAAINRGNSGGPLLDSSGRVIGINSAIFSPTGASAGVGFAVPIDAVRRLLPDLLTLGRYRHPWLGIRYAYPISPGFAEILKLPISQGLLLVQIYDSSPMAGAGVRGAQREAIIGNQRVYIGGDILVAVDSYPITRLQQLEALLEENYRVGDTVILTILRDNVEMELPVELVEEPS
jgi:S1-C subfamily serine protease